MSDHMTNAEYEASGDVKNAAHEADALERSDAAKVAAVAAVLEREYVPLPEYRTDVAHGAVQVIEKVRAALGDPDAALAAVRAEARAEALRDAADAVEAGCIHVGPKSREACWECQGAARIVRSEAVQS